MHEIAERPVGPDRIDLSPGIEGGAFPDRVAVEVRPDAGRAQLVQYVETAAPVLEPLEIAVKSAAHARVPFADNHLPPGPRQHDGAGEPRRSGTDDGDRRVRLRCGGDTVPVGAHVVLRWFSAGRGRLATTV